MKTEIRPTPETDALHAKQGLTHASYRDFARKLERERDEAKERAESKHGLWMAELSRVTELEKQLETMREAIKEAFNSFADDPQSDSVWLMNDRQASAIVKLKPFIND